MSCCQHNVSKIRCTTALGACDRALGAECLLPLPDVACQVNDDGWLIGFSGDPC